MKEKIFACLGVLPILAFSPIALADAVNTGTGECSENVTVIEIKTSKVVVNTNDASADNDVDVNLSTGDNEIGGAPANEETKGPGSPQESIAPDFESTPLGSGGGGSIKTGDASVKITINNDFNENETVIDPEDEDVPSGGGGGTANESGGIGGGSETLADASADVEATTLPEAGSNMPLVALSLGFGGIALWSFLRRVKESLLVR